MALSVTINLLWFIPWTVPSLCTLGLKNFCKHTQTHMHTKGTHSGVVTIDYTRVKNRTQRPCTHSFQGAVGLLHAQSPQGPDEVESKWLCLFPATYQQTDPDLPQDQCFPEKTVDTRPVPWHGHRVVGMQPVGHRQSLIL